MVATANKKIQLGWYGDDGLGERMIQLILDGRKTVTTCPAYDKGDVEAQVGDRITLTDKHGRARCVIEVLRIEIRPLGKFDEALASAAGMTLAQLNENVRLGNARQVKEDEDMRVVVFRVTERRSS